MHYNDNELVEVVSVGVKVQTNVIKIDVYKFRWK